MTFRPQPFVLLGWVLAFVWFGWQLALILALLQMELTWE